MRVHGSDHGAVEVDCYPFYDIVLACHLLGLRQNGVHEDSWLLGSVNEGSEHLPGVALDVLFLDVQGPEYDILRTVPWKAVDIKVWKQNLLPLSFVSGVH